jgi:hypothetical protein
LARYVFIVGLPRTGTKLIKNVLESAPHVRCKLSPETFFLGHFRRPGVRRRLRELGDLRDDAAMERVADLFYSGKLQGTYWQHLRKGKLGVSRESFLEALLSCERTEKDIYRVVLGIHAPRGDDVILGDKTPGHLYHVPTILEWFPHARVVHTFRDPRAILASEWKRRMKARPQTLLARLTSPLASFAIVLHTTITWLHAVKLHRRYRRLYPESYYLSRFEDLVREPEESARRLCDFLGIGLRDEMLNPRQVGSSFERESASGFDRDTLTRWRSHLRPWMNAWLWLWCRRPMKELGYLEPAAPAIKSLA